MSDAQIINQIALLVYYVLKNNKRFKDLSKSDPPGECRTIYLSNIKESIDLATLKEELTKLCKKFGNLIDVQCLSSFWRKGQAFISFRDLDSAKQAVNELPGLIFFDQPLKCQFARTESNVLRALDNLPKVEKSPHLKPLSIRQREESIKNELNHLIDSYNNATNSQADNKRLLNIPLSNDASSKNKMRIIQSNVLVIDNCLESEEKIKNEIENQLGFIKTRAVAHKNIIFIDCVDNNSAAQIKENLEKRFPSLSIGYVKRGIN